MEIFSLDVLLLFHKSVSNVEIKAQRFGVKYVEAQTKGRGCLLLNVEHGGVTILFVPELDSLELLFIFVVILFGDIYQQNNHRFFEFS